jgi:hypothetical protein
VCVRVRKGGGGALHENEHPDRMGGGGVKRRAQCGRSACAERGVGSAGRRGRTPLE